MIKKEEENFNNSFIIFSISIFFRNNLCTEIGKFPITSNKLDVERLDIFRDLWMLHSF